MKSFYFVLFLFFCSVFGLLGQTPPQNIPKTPTEAYERAITPLREFFKAKEATLADNVKANKEKERLAKEYVRHFKTSDWKGSEAFSLAQLYEMTNQSADVEKALTIYLRQPEPDKLTKARVMLLYALLNQKKVADAIPVAEQLLNEPKYTSDIIVNVQDLIGMLRTTNIKRAISLAEKRLPKLINYNREYFEKNPNNPGHPAKMFDYALDLASMYREAGEGVKAQEFISSFLSQFNSSPMASNKRIKESIDATLLRFRLIGTQASPVEGVEYIDMPKVALADLRGKVVMLDFLAHWCAPCIASFPETNALKQKYEPQGLVIVGITSYYGFFGNQEKLSVADELIALKKLRSQNNVNFGFLVGPRTNEAAYGVAGLPAVALIDRLGKIRYIKQGSDYKKDVESIIQTLITDSTHN